jgi:hypothetical protein
MATADIKLSDDYDGQVTVTAADLIVDGGPNRRKTSSGQVSQKTFKRAFVHDVGDMLWINYDNDYEGGVTINGVKKIATKPGQPLTIESGFLELIAGSAEFALQLIHLKCQPDKPEGVKITGNVQFENDVTVTKIKAPKGSGWGTGVVTIEADNIINLNSGLSINLNASVRVKGKASPGVTPPYYDLADEISKLRERVEALEKK